MLLKYSIKVYLFSFFSVHLSRPLHLGQCILNCKGVGVKIPQFFLQHFTLKHKYSYSPHYSFHISYYTENENLFDNQELHKLKFVSLILMTHTFDLRVTVYGEIRNLSLLGANGSMRNYPLTVPLFTQEYICSKMQFNRVNNKEHQHSLVVSSYLHMRMHLNTRCSLFEAFLHML